MATQTRRQVSYGLSEPLIDIGQAPIVAKRDPEAKDRAQIGTEWVNTLTNNAFFLTSIEDNIATWVPITNVGTSPTFDTDGGPAVPVADTINIVGGAGINTAGAGNTITISLTGGAPVDSVTGGNNITITGTAANPIVNVSGTTNHAVQVGNATNSLTSLAVGATNTVLLGATGANPSFGAVPNAALSNSSITLSNGQNITVTGSPVSLGGTATIAVSGVIPIANGGTNASSMATTDGVVYYDGTRLVTTAAGTATQVLTSNGAGVAPTFQAAGGGSGIITINGNVGSVTGATVTLDTQVPFDPVQGTPHFEGSGTHMWLNFSDDNGSNNICIGRAAYDGSNGGHNISLGEGTFSNITTGSYSVAVGDSAGSSYTSSESSNVLLNSHGTVGDSHTLRIGAATGSAQQNLNRAFICGIDGVNVGSVAKVVTMASDQLGTASIAAGTGISVTPSANTITIANTASGIGNVLAMSSGATYLDFNQAGTTAYTAPYLGAASTTQANAQFITPVAGTVSKMYVNVAANASTTDTTLTVYKNSAPTSIVVTITALTTGVFTDLTHTISVSAGDLIQWVGNAATIGPVSGTASMLLA